jgi:hypothetical protein
MTAGAATTHLGPVTPGIPKAFSGSMIPAGTFDDIFTFILPVNSGSGYTVMNLPIMFPGGNFNTLLTTMSLFSNPNGTLFDSDDAHLKTVAASDPGQSASTLSFLFGAAPPGSMYLKISGVTNGTAGGLYNGAISVSAIPEAEVWAMMLVGAGLVGFQLRRKAKRTAIQRFV